MLLQVGIKVLIRNSLGQYLLLKRSQVMDGETTTSWDIPGGRIKSNESLDDALKRELNEEIGSVPITSKKELIAAQDIFVKNKDLHVVRLTNIINPDIKTITLSHEHSEYIWVEQQELSKILIEPYLKEVVERIS